MMNFEIVEQSILDNVLEPAEAGRFITIGGIRQRDSADVIDAKRKVMIIYNAGQFPKPGSASYGAVKHKMSFDVVLVEATPAKADLSVLNSESASASEKATALRKMAEPSLEANRNINAFIRIIYQILMDARNEQMGLNPPADNSNLKLVADRWIESIDKGDPMPDGEFVVLTASMRLTLTMSEAITGDDLPDTPEGGAIFDSDIDLDGDDTEKTGVTVTNAP